MLLDALVVLNAWVLKIGGEKVDFSFTLNGLEIKLEQVELDDRHEKYECADGPVRVTPDEVVSRAAPSGLEAVSLHASGPSPAANII